MGIFRSLFGGGKNAEAEARQLMTKVEEFLDENGPMMTVQFMASNEFKRLEREYWPKELVGPNGPLHGGFLALLAKIKARGDREFGTTDKAV